MRIHSGLALGVAVAGLVAIAPQPAGALEVPGWGPVTVGPVTLDPNVSVDPDGIDAGADASVRVPNLPPVDLGVTTGVDEGGLTGDVRLPSAPIPPVSIPPVSIPPVPEPVAGIVDDLLPGPGAPGFGSIPPAAGTPTPSTESGSPGAGAPAASVAPVATTDERALDGEAAVSGAMIEPRRGIWSTIGQAAGRFGPWAGLIALAFAVQLVARSALRERLRARPS